MEKAKKEVHYNWFLEESCVCVVVAWSLMLCEVRVELRAEKPHNFFGSLCSFVKRCARSEHKQRTYIFKYHHGIFSLVEFS